MTWSSNKFQFANLRRRLITSDQQNYTVVNFTRKEEDIRTKYTYSATPIIRTPFYFYISSIRTDSEAKKLQTLKKESNDSVDKSTYLCIIQERARGSPI